VAFCRGVWVKYFLERRHRRIFGNWEKFWS